MLDYIILKKTKKLSDIYHNDKYIVRKCIVYIRKRILKII